MYCARTYTPELRARRIGAALVLVGVTLTPVAIWVAWVLEAGQLLELKSTLLLAGVFSLIGGLFQLITGQSAIRR
jgi:hypothetical protein